MKEYDVIVIGSGAGLDILETAAEHGLKTALIDRGPAGGTCLNVGCIPSKMLIFPADRIMEIREAEKLGVKAEVIDIDFQAIMQRMHDEVDTDSENIRKSLKNSNDIDYYEDTGEFIDSYTLKVGDQTLRAKQIYIAAGTRPFIPPIKGLDSVEHLNNETLLQLEKAPRSLIIVGGSYIGVEFAHFFEAMGTRVTVLEMENRLLSGEEPEISSVVEKALKNRMTVMTGVEAQEVKTASDGGIVVVCSDRSTGEKREITAEKLLLATGRRSNADLLKVEKTGINTDARGFIEVDEYLETNIKGIFAVGDINGRELFTHTAHAEAAVAGSNGIHGQRNKMDYKAAPHAVFTHPQIASVGLSEADAAKSFNIKVGKANYSDTALGIAMVDREGFAKIILEQETDRILGAHIVGPWASVLIQEIINAMTDGSGFDAIAKGLHIHPALSELVQRALFNAEKNDG